MIISTKSKALNLILFFLSSALTSNVFAQTNNGLSKSDFNRIINQQFGNLISPISNNNIGNFASLDLKDAKVTFNGTSFFKNGSFIGIKASGGVADGLLPIFTNATLNTNMSLDFQYNFLNLNNQGIMYDDASFRAMNEQKEKVLEEYAVKQKELDTDYQITSLQLEIEILKQKLAKASTALGAATSLFKADSIKFQMFKLQHLIDSKGKELSNYPNNKIARQFDLDNAKATELKKLKENLKIVGFKFGWFSIGYGIKSSSFKLFDSSLAFDEQIIKKTFASHYFRFQYSFYKYSPFPHESFFWSIGANAALEDNLTELNSKELSEITNYGANPGDRSSTKKFNAYEGSYISGLQSVSLNADFYWFMFEDNKGAFHFYPEYKIKEKMQPTTNLNFGYLMSFKNQDKSGNTVNAELFLALQNIYGANDIDIAGNLFKRSTLGLRFTFPINFNPKS
jgi:uncharacterized small protein (DUF1192 family)